MLLSSVSISSGDPSVSSRALICSCNFFMAFLFSSVSALFFLFLQPEIPSLSVLLVFRSTVFEFHRIWTFRERFLFYLFFTIIFFRKIFINLLSTCALFCGHQVIQFFASSRHFNLKSTR